MAIRRGGAVRGVHCTAASDAASIANANADSDAGDDDNAIFVVVDSFPAP